MKNKFEELYIQYIGYSEELKKIAEEQKADREKLANDAQNMSAKEMNDLVYKLNTKFQKANNDMSILSIRLKTVFDLIEDRDDMSSEVLDTMSKVTVPPSYYIFKDGSLKEINPELHAATLENYEKLLSQFKEEEEEDE